MAEEEAVAENLLHQDEEEEESHKNSNYKSQKEGMLGIIKSGVNLINMLSDELHWSFVMGVITVYGISQGLSMGLSRATIQYYLKDEHKIQPSQAQLFMGIVRLPWVVKPFWGLLTDVLPIFGFRRRPYFIFAGCLGVISMLILSIASGLHVVPAMLFLMAGSAGVAIADVTIDACIAENSCSHPSLASDMQSLCGLSSSTGALAAMWATIKCRHVWRPCVYMYLSLALGVNIHEGLFYWYTDAQGGPLFSKEAVGSIYAIGALGSLFGVLLYQNTLKNHPFRDLLLCTQLLHVASGMLDLILVLRLNLVLFIPDYLFIVIDEGVSHMIGRVRWMPLLVLSSKLCPPGIEGTFFALLMSIDQVGLLTSSWLGGIVLHTLHVTRTEFDNLWIAVLIRNILRITPIFLLFLVPRSDPNSPVLSLEISKTKDDSEMLGSENHELFPLVDSS
ncbi:hypothetical protein KSS87_023707 [Heliosperma pusillum]|nr:hypothetical protein KSS87_023707 [Heliosperma pusillum]